MTGLVPAKRVLTLLLDRWIIDEDSLAYKDIRALPIKEGGHWPIGGTTHGVGQRCICGGLIINGTCENV